MKSISKYPNHRAVRREAAEVLSAEGNRLKLIEALCLCLLLVPLHFVIGELFTVLSVEFVMIPSPVLMWIRYAVFFFLTLLVTMPLILGLFGMAERMERGGDCALLDLFAPFASWKSYANHVWLAWRILWLPVLMWALIWGGSELSDLLIVNATDRLMIKIFLWILVVVVGVILIMCRFGTIALEMRREGLKRLEKISGVRRYRGFDRFLSRYLLRILLGLLSIGILLLMDVIPEMLIAYFRYCRYMNDNDVTSEE